MLSNQEKTEAFLAHYGVKGMKWGVRKQDTTGSRQSMAKRLDESWFGRLSKANVERYNRKVAKKKLAEAQKQLEKQKGKAGGEVNPAVVMLGLYGGLAVTAITTQSIMKYRDSGRRDAKQTGDREFKKDPSLAKKMPVSQLHAKVSKPINPGYGEPGTQMNCRRATYAYEMRRRGYDVKATKSKFASGQTIKGVKNASQIDKNAKFESPWGEKNVSNPHLFMLSSPQKKADLVFDSLKTQPNGARGELAVSWLMGGGHSMSWEVVNKKPVIFDNQNGKMYDSPKAFSEFTPVTTTAAYTRLDNKPINNEFIKRWVTDAD